MANSGGTVAYRSLVTDSDAWPSISWITFISVPAARASTTDWCRRSWSRIGGSLDAATRASNRSVIRDGRSGAPFGFGEHHPQFDPAITPREPSLALRETMLAQRLPAAPVEDHDAEAGGGLGRAFLDFVSTSVSWEVMCIHL